MSVACEIATIRVATERVTDFLSGIRVGAEIIASQPGCHGVRLMRCLEEPRTFLLFADWSSVADHERFRESDAFGAYRATVQHTFDGAPTFKHFALIDWQAGKGHS